MGTVRSTLDVELAQLRTKLAQVDAETRRVDDKVDRARGVADRARAAAVAADRLADRVAAKVASVGRQVGRLAALELGQAIVSEIVPDESSDLGFALNQLARLGTQVGFGALAGGPAGAVVGGIAGLYSLFRAGFVRMEQKQAEMERRLAEREKRDAEARREIERRFAESDRRNAESLLQAIISTRRSRDQTFHQITRYMFTDFLGRG